VAARWGDQPSDQPPVGPRGDATPAATSRALERALEQIRPVWQERRRQLGGELAGDAVGAAGESETKIAIGVPGARILEPDCLRPIVAGWQRQTAADRRDPPSLAARGSPGTRQPRRPPMPTTTGPRLVLPPLPGPVPAPVPSRDERARRLLAAKIRDQDPSVWFLDDDDPRGGGGDTPRRSTAADRLRTGLGTSSRSASNQPFNGATRRWTGCSKNVASASSEAMTPSSSQSSCQAHPGRGQQLNGLLTACQGCSATGAGSHSPWWRVVDTNPELGVGHH
jgi:hypothetical protein